MLPLFSEPFSSARVDSLTAFYQSGRTVEVLRLDELHPIVSGNKWFKLSAYLQQALDQNKKVILTFGGAYSNHLVATAAAAGLAGLQSVGLVRGEEPASLSPTLLQAKELGMQLWFLSREAYRQAVIPAAVYEQFAPGEVYRVPAGGYGILGREGAARILQAADTGSYTDIVAAVGTGTMLAGLTASAAPYQRVTGISVLKNHHSGKEEIRNLLEPGHWDRFTLLTDYHFGGYARSSAELFRFMNGLYAATGLPSDFVYTAKLFFAVGDLLRRSYFPEGARLLLVHSGGLQGNRSLPKGTLIF